MMSLALDLDEVVIEFDGPHFHRYLAMVKSLGFPRFYGKSKGWRIPIRLWPRFAPILANCPETPTMSPDLYDRIVAEHEAREFTLNVRAAGDFDFHPDGFVGELHPFQRVGAAYLAGGRRVALCDDVGLGKTVQTIAAMSDLLARGEIESVLVIVPGHLKRQWAREIATFTGNGLAPTVIDGPPKKRAELWAAVDVVAIANYELLQRDGEPFARPWDLVIIDEAQQIKTSRTHSARLCRSLDAPLRWALTATAIENSLPELYSIMEFLAPGSFGEWNEFDRKFIRRDFWGKIKGYRNLEEIRDIIRPHFLRRRVEDLDVFVPKHAEDVGIEFTPDHRAVYLDVAQGLFESLDEFRAQAVNEATALERSLYLREVADDPRLIDREIEGRSSKLDVLNAILEEANDKGERVVVFTQWERMARIIAEEIGAEKITGKMQFGARDNAFKRWADGYGPLVTTDCSRSGLNLQSANWVVNFEPHWNPAVMRQREGRVWRLTQDRPVQARTLYIRDSIEDDVLDVVAGKLELFEAIMNAIASAIRGGGDAS